MTTEITRWDTFAAAVLAGVAANPNSGCNSPKDFAHWAAQVADAMMRERAAREHVDAPAPLPNGTPWKRKRRPESQRQFDPCFVSPWSGATGI